MTRYTKMGGKKQFEKSSGGFEVTPLLPRREGASDRGGRGGSRGGGRGRNDRGSGRGGFRDNGSGRGGFRDNGRGRGGFRDNDRGGFRGMKRGRGDDDFEANKRSKNENMSRFVTTVDPQNTV
ncbi:hypothetical protein K501DRAFT_52543 [Backusella circina FSU 941]|nr:hypothetical protein K501DRAFT_52543 [Backusella circina FSU 941]